MFMCVYLRMKIHMEILSVVQIEIEYNFCCFAQKLMETLHFEISMCKFCNSDGWGGSSKLVFYPNSSRLLYWKYKYFFLGNNIFFKDE